MSKQFTMSMFASKEDLYKAKAEYWEKIAIDSVSYSLWENMGRTPTEDEVAHCISKIEYGLGL